MRMSSVGLTNYLRKIIRYFLTKPVGQCLYYVNGDNKIRYEGETLNTNKTIYHYCSIDTLLCILKSNEIRLCDIEKSNDYAEKSWMMNLVNSIFQNVLSSKKASLENITKLTEAFHRITQFYEDATNVYGSCFSAEGDLLSQWRAYAQDGYGVSIGFSHKILDELNNDPYGIRFLPIIYNPTEQEKYAAAQAEKIIDLLLKGDYLFHAISEVFENDIQNICRYKNPAFSEEKEWRLLIAFSPEIRDKKAKFGSFIMSEAQILSKENRIITYVNLNFEKVKDKLVKEIILGPKCKVSIKDLSQTIHILGYDNTNIEIKKSVATYW